MKRQSLSIYNTLLLTFLLLVGQSSVLWHQTHTELHHAGELCSYCVQAADLHSPASNAPQALVVIDIDHASVISYLSREFIAPVMRPRQGRAPPVLS